MAIADRWTIKMTNDNVNEINYAEFGIELSAASEATPTQQWQQIVGYVLGAASQVCAAGTRIREMTYRPSTSSVSSPFPWDAASYNIMASTNVANYPWLVEMDDYGDDIGDSGTGLSPLGTSVVVTEYSATGGPAGRGRHYIPFINGDCITAGGYLGSAQRATIELCYKNFILDLGLSPAPTGTGDLTPVVENAAGTTAKTIVTCKAQPVFSNLKSRRR